MSPQINFSPGPGQPQLIQAQTLLPLSSRQLRLTWTSRCGRVTGSREDNSEPAAFKAHSTWVSSSRLQ
ncbi:hypothetical protein AAFF_G00395570 [Aldrovandia affinis]|uniref:Uncharacterized protein n=1 Tax=Aldrovandia affinis TaxID=143900 RepID=A0AAD7SDF2_9TELE|nr:hypothetical protein AAFF_G00395570 [Aldrovandia affinis]